MQRLTTKQLIFNKVYRGLIKQGKKSIIRGGKRSGECQYRLGELRCAAGFCITNKNYDPDLEGLIANCDDVVSAISKSIVRELSEGDKDFLLELQGIHDDKKPSQWKKEFKAVAKVYNLTIPEIK